MEYHEEEALRRSMLQSLVAGEYVVVKSKWSEKVCPIKKITKTQIVLPSHNPDFVIRFHRDDGYEIGERYNLTKITRKATQDEVDKEIVAQKKRDAEKAENDRRNALCAEARAALLHFYLGDPAKLKVMSWSKDEKTGQKIYKIEVENLTEEALVSLTARLSHAVDAVRAADDPEDGGSLSPAGHVG